MPVSHVLKQRLVQQFQQKQHSDNLAAQASRAAHSDDHPHSSGSRDPAVQGVERPPDHHQVDKPQEPLHRRPMPQPPISLFKPALQVAKHRHPLAQPQPQQPPQLHRPQQPQPPPPPPKSQGRGKRDRDPDHLPTIKETTTTSAAIAPPPQQPESVRQRIKPSAPLHRLKSQPSVTTSKTIPTKPPPSQPQLQSQTVPQTLPESQRRFKKRVDVATTPLDILDGGDKGPRSLGHVPATTCTSYSELWTAVRKVCGDQVNRATARLCYQDTEDDWISLLPDAPFSIFSTSVKRVLIVVNKKTP